jgi:hypothetical protein
MRYITELVEDEPVVKELVVDPHDDWSGIQTIAPVIKAVVRATIANKKGVATAFFKADSKWTHEEHAAALAEQNKSYAKIVQAMDLLIKDFDYDLDGEEARIVDDGLLEFAAVWHTLWT